MNEVKFFSERICNSLSTQFPKNDLVRILCSSQITQYAFPIILASATALFAGMLVGRYCLAKKREWTLIEEVQQGNLQGVREILFKVRDLDQNGNNPLHAALLNGNLNISAELLQSTVLRGSYLKTANHAGDYPIHIAARDENADNFNAIVCVSEEFNQRDGEGNTPVMLLAEREKWDEVDLILSPPSTIDLSLTNKQGKTAAMIAEEKGNHQMAELLGKR
jgi:hypothetical protein